MANNGQIRIQIGGDAQQFTQAASQAGSAAAQFGKAIGAAGNASEHAFDEIAAGAAAMDRITASIGKMVGAALTGATSLDKFASTAIKAITPLSTFEQRLDEINTAIGRIGTVQGAAQLGVQFDLLSRNLQDTRKLIDDATKSAIGLSRAFATVSTASTSLNRLSPAIRPALTDLKLLPPAANAAAAALTKVKPGAGQAAQSLTDVGRILQDLPFGFVGIQNNLGPLAENFNRLKLQAGGTGGALKAIGSSLLGAGGIGLALSAVTAAVTFATVGFGAWSKILGTSKKETEEHAKALQDFVESLKSVEQVTAEATGSAAGQIAQVQALASAVQDSNLAYGQRKRALEELKQVNKAYFGDLTLEERSLASLTAKVDEYTKALVNQAIVKGFSDEIGRVSVELGKQSLETDKLRNRLRQLNDQLATTPRLSSNAQGVTSQSKAYSQLVSSIQETTKQFNQQRDAEERIATNRALLTAQLKAATVEGLKYLDVTGKGTEADKKAEDALRKRIDALKTLRDSIGLSTAQQRELIQLEVQLLQRDGVKLGFTPEEVQDRVDDLIKNTRFGRGADGTIVASIPIRIVPTIDVGGSVLPDGQIPENAFDGVVNAIKSNAALRFVEMQKSLAEGIRASIVNGVIEGLFAAGNALGEVVAAAFNGESVGKVLAAAGESLLKIVGSVLQDIGKQIIIASKLITSLRTKLATLITNPTASLAVGIGLVALGGLLKSIKLSQGVPGFADGVTNFAGGAALVGERGPEIVTLPAGANVIPNNPFDALSNITLVSQIRGDDIFLSYNRTSGRRRRV